ncbi:hypothetical protein OESDEN_10154 [Oesophagostomum dentatum]|uniref:Uncharacterized protein n=1 Tax=Oesophagostomum dentatum TaxID=61180 RepID=A0A0B1T3N3_OESDE|nr:hypothetical protein OESDEN_10154 [Oesophagostomum dentatum]
MKLPVVLFLAFVIILAEAACSDRNIGENTPVREMLRKLIVSGGSNKGAQASTNTNTTTAAPKP